MDMDQLAEHIMRRLIVQGHLQVLEEIRDILQMTMIIRGTATMTMDVRILMVKLVMMLTMIPVSKKCTMTAVLQKRQRNQTQFLLLRGEIKKDPSSHLYLVLPLAAVRILPRTSTQIV